ncbi:unnamed protein product [Anisakis simplex]|uniref:Phosphoenolpyruvate carboxykinase GTP-utilising N-terminal domain-containing protein n=1 Tax=Anisakis simplex TaxID=6269 RepID=A0A3P6NZK2_ANISI|nr:unnamed protein product [Anisakis simplex]
MRPLPTNSYSVINNVEIENIGSMPIFKGDLRQLPVKVQRFVIEKAYLMRPRGIYICDGSSREADEIVSKLVDCGTFSVLTAYENNYICRTNQMVLLLLLPSLLTLNSGYYNRILLISTDFSSNGKEHAD